MNTKAFKAICLAVALSGLTVRAAVFQEVGGAVVMEAEHFHQRTVAADNHHWHTVPDDDGVDQFGDSVATWGSNGGLPFVNARNNKYIQVFPDSTGGGQNKNAANLVGTDAFAAYQVRINTTGTYRLWLRWGGYDGSSDSMYAEIVELRDGAGPNADWYRVAANIFGDFTLAGGGTGWDSITGTAQDVGGGPGVDPLLWTISAAGIYTIKISQREDGAAVDALILQLNSLPDPTEPGPAESLCVGGPCIFITRAPANATAGLGGTVTFTIQAESSVPLTYQWQRAEPGSTNFANISGATGTSFTTGALSSGDNGAQYRCVVTAGAVSEPSAAASLTVDTTPPTIVRALGSGNFTNVTVTFSEPIDPTTGTNASNYAISGSVTVSSARLQSPETVILVTSPQTEGQTYTLTVNNVRDRVNPANTIAPNSQVTFAGAIFRTGIAFWERWQDQGGDTAAIDTFELNLADPNFRPPNVTGVSTYLGSPRGVADNYGVRAYAWFIPPQTGSYVFFLACDDQGYLFLSTDATPTNKKRIAAQPSWSNQNEWNDPDTTEVRSDMFTASEWTPPNTIDLTAGSRYYIEMIFREGGGGDGGEVYYKLATAADPANGTAPNTTGSVIGSFVDPSGLPPVITNRPAGVVFNRGDTLTFSVGVESILPVTYQWYRSKQPIAAATNNPLVIANADHTAIGDYYVDVSNANGTVSSFPDDDVRAIMTGAFLIEAEDFNHSGGQHVAAASTMPYAGNAYENLVPVFDVDFSNDGDESGGAAFAYTGRFTPGDFNVLEMKGGLASETADPVQNAINRERGGFSVTANYATGWTDMGDWQNYTRNFPDGMYVIYGGHAHDGRAANEINMIMSLVTNPTVPDGSSPPTEGGLQGLTRIGTFLSPGTGAWSSNDLIPLREGTGAGPIAQVQLNGLRTLRLTFNAADGDADYFLLYRLPAAAPVITSVSIAGGNVTVNWTGGGTLEWTTSLNTIPATWTTTGDSDGSYGEAVGAGNRFFRVRQ